MTCMGVTLNLVSSEIKRRFCKARVTSTSPLPHEQKKEKKERKEKTHLRPRLRQINVPLLLKVSKLILQDRDEFLPDVGHVRIERPDEARVVREDVLTVSGDGTEDLRPGRQLPISVILLGEGGERRKERRKEDKRTLTNLFLAAFPFRNANSNATASIESLLEASGRRAKRALSCAAGPAGREVEGSSAAAAPAEGAVGFLRE